MCVDDVVGKGPGRCYLPHQRMPFNSKNEGLYCVSMTWRATSGRPYHLHVALHLHVGAAHDAARHGAANHARHHHGGEDHAVRDVLQAGSLRASTRPKSDKPA